jgi:lysosomal alpha-mannosidase
LSQKYWSTQAVPIHPAVYRIPGRNSRAKFELVFKAESIPPLGFKSFHVSKKSALAKIQLSQEQKLSTSSKTLVGNDELLMVFDTQKRLRNIVTRENIYDITQNYGWYEGSPGK